MHSDGSGAEGSLSGGEFPPNAVMGERATDLEPA